ncbi:MAG TPA: EF-hand domain-containing protein [Thermoanaerobaculia bacterium]
MKLRALGVALLGLWAAVPAAAQDPAEFDLDGDGRLDEAELSAFVLHLADPAFSDIDQDRDGKISDDERSFFELELMDARKKCGDPPYALEEVEGCFSLAPEEASLGGLLIRRSHEIVNLSEPEESFDIAEPALLAYARDRKEDSSQWQVQGALLRPFFLHEAAAGSSSRLSAVLLVPSVSFDRLGTTEEDEEGGEIDSLVFRLGVDFETIPKKASPFFDLQNYRFYLSYATDFSWDSDVRALEIEWEPQMLSAGIGMYRSLGKSFPLSCRGRIILHVEGGEVHDGGDNPDLVEDESFLRIGPKAQLDLQPDFYKRLTLSLGWDHHYGISGEPGRTELATIGLSWALDTSEHVSLEAVFQNGQLPLTLEETETIEVGIGLKF